MAVVFDQAIIRSLFATNYQVPFRSKDFEKGDTEVHIILLIFVFSQCPYATDKEIVESGLLYMHAVSSRPTHQHSFVHSQTCMTCAGSEIMELTEKWAALVDYLDDSSSCAFSKLLNNCLLFLYRPKLSAARECIYSVCDFIHIYYMMNPFGFYKVNKLVSLLQMLLLLCW